MSNDTQRRLRQAALLIGLVLCLCGYCPREIEMKKQPMSIDAVLARETPRLLSVPGVVGTGQGVCDGRPCIYVYASSMTPEARSRIPAALDGYPVVIEETGEIKNL